MKTIDDIVQALSENTFPLDGFLNFGAADLLAYLTFDHARPFLEDTATAEKWGDPKLLDRDTVIADMREYMPFAWEKARDHRGLSAGRSVNHMQALTWLIDEDGVFDWDNYAQYGAPILAAICERYGFPIPDGADIENMRNGEPCTPGCQDGCGT